MYPCTNYMWYAAVRCRNIKAISVAAMIDLSSGNLYAYPLVAGRFQEGAVRACPSLSALIGQRSSPRLEE